MSPEERAAFGGKRDRAARGRRGVYVTRPSVIRRLAASGYDIWGLHKALHRWKHQLQEKEPARLDAALADGHPWWADPPTGDQLDEEAEWDTNDAA